MASASATPARQLAVAEVRLGQDPAALIVGQR